MGMVEVYFELVEDLDGKDEELLEVKEAIYDLALNCGKYEISDFRNKLNKLVERVYNIHGEVEAYEYIKHLLVADIQRQYDRDIKNGLINQELVEKYSHIDNVVERYRAICYDIRDNLGLK